MAKVDLLVKDFLAQRKVAVVGVPNTCDTGCNANYQKSKDAGYRVFAVNPHMKDFKGDPCYTDLRSLPEKPDAVFILASPQVTERIMGECLELGVKHVSMHCLMGNKPGVGASMTSVSPRAVELCHQNGISVIPGSCPNQFLNPDFGHALMRGFARLVGNLNVN